MTRKQKEVSSRPEGLNRALAEAVNARYPAAVKLRRALHMHPELAFAEHWTGETIAVELKRCGCRVQTGVGRTGVVGVLESGDGGPVAAVRSDMDALPVAEQTGLPFASKIAGVMHACGHDSHMSTVASTAAVMSKLRPYWSGTIKFIFQPSEEVCPGGAVGMIADGVLKRPDVGAIFGLHVDPWIPVGRIGLRDGAMMAQADDFDLTVFGKSGHGARPHLGHDAVYIAAQIVSALQSVVSRSTDPLQPAVVSIGKITGGTARNIMAGEVAMEGTVRSLDETEARRLRKHVERVSSGVARALGGRVKLDYLVGYPVLVNHRSINDLYRAAIRDAFGGRSIVELKEPLMGGEDFAYYLQKVPGAMMRLGVRNPEIGAVHAWHHPQFTIDEKAMAVGTHVICGALLRYLNSTT
ncbi:MAG: amidohydrolase [Candidatus Zixiibacteriota bacterium]